MHPRSSNTSAATPPETAAKIAEKPHPAEVPIPAGKDRKRDLNHARLPFPRYSSRRPESTCRPRRLFHVAPRTNSRRRNR